MKNHQPTPIAIYENVGAKVAATGNFARFLAPTRFLDAMSGSWDLDPLSPDLLEPVSGQVA